MADVIRLPGDYGPQPFTGNLPSLPSLPELPPLEGGGFFEGPAQKFESGEWERNPPLPGITGIFPDWLSPKGDLATIFGILTDPGRIVVVFLGLIFVAGGLYLLGTSQVAGSLESVVKRAAA